MFGEDKEIVVADDIESHPDPENPMLLLFQIYQTAIESWLKSNGWSNFKILLPVATFRSY